MIYDYIIIGSGIIGTMIARELSKFDVSVLVLEKENDVANDQTTANSAIIHSGHDPIENTLKSKLCVLGNKLYDQLENELNIPLLRTGALVVSTTDEEDKMIDVLYQRALNNGVPDVKVIGRKEALQIEPNLNQTIIRALVLPTTKVTYPWEVAFACLENAVSNGVAFQKNSRVTQIVYQKNHYAVEINSNEIINTHSVINASGIFSDQIAALLEKNVMFKINPRKGEYLVLDRRVKGLFEHVIYPIPNRLGKGVLIVPQVHGNILVGPTGTTQVEKTLASTTLEGLDQLKNESKKLSLKIPYHMTIRSFAGIRASSSYEDFYIKESLEYPKFYHVAGIDSPGLTAAPAIASYLINEIIKIKSPLDKKYNPYRKKDPLFNTLSYEEKLSKIKEQPKHGHIVCKCEKITEQEIIDAIHSGIQNDTIKGLKKRIRAGSGLCQGGYCEHQVLKIIARETNQNLDQINYYAKNTPILVKETKVKK